MYDRDGNGRFVRFDSWGDFLAYAQQPPSKAWEGSYDAAALRAVGNREWRGTDSFADAVSLAENGWVDGERQVKDLTERMTAKLLQGIVREDWRYDVEGSTFDVARYVEGEPEHWIAPDETYERGIKTVRVIVNMSVSGGVEGKRLIQRGIAAAALVEALTYAGVKVELWTTLSTTRNAYRGEWWIQLKAADQPTETARLAFALAHPAMVRRLGFGAMAQTDMHVSGWGTPSEASHWQTDNRLVKDDEDTIYLKQLHLSDADFASAESTERWILAKLATHGVQIRGLNAD